MNVFKCAPETVPRLCLHTVERRTVDSKTVDLLISIYKTNIFSFILIKSYVVRT